MINMKTVIKAVQKKDYISYEIFGIEVAYKKIDSLNEFVKTKLITPGLEKQLNNIIKSNQEIEYGNQQ